MAIGRRGFAVVSALLFSDAPAVAEPIRTGVANGVASFAIPDNWKRASEPKYDLYIDSTRHDPDGEKWARCLVRTLSTPNLGGRDQNDFNDEMQKRRAEQLVPPNSGKRLLKFSNSEFAGDARIIAFDFEEDGAVFSVRQVSVVHGIWATIIYADCAGSAPFSATDRKDVDAFLGSLQIKGR